MGWISVILPGGALRLLQIIKFQVKLFPFSKVSVPSDRLQSHSFRLFLYGYGMGYSNRTELGGQIAGWCIGLSPQIQDSVSVLCPNECLILHSGATSAREAERATLCVAQGSWLGHAALTVPNPVQSR